MKIRQVFGSRLVPPGADAITLYPFIFYRHKHPPKKIIDHEWVHIRQIEETGWVRFYVSYLLYYLANRIAGFDHYNSYFSIPYETEAFLETE